jgi:hypothetical protein
MTATTLSGIVDPMQLGETGPAQLPWDDPAFSKRMLAEHLDQKHLEPANEKTEEVDGE